MDSIVLDSERELRVPPAEARAAIVRFLKAQEFTLTAEQVSMVTAKRGSQIAGAVQPRKLPLAFRATIQPAPAGGSTVTVHLADAWRSPVQGKVWGMNGPYRTVLHDVQTALDDALRPLLVVGVAVAAPEAVTSTRDVPLLGKANAGVLKGSGAVADKVDAVLTPGDAHTTPKTLKEVVLRSSKGVASFDRMAVEGLLTVGLLVSTKPGSMPANLARDVEALSAKLEQRVAAQPEGRITCDLDDAEIPVAEFLAKQAAIRESLPLRTLHVCTTCKFEKIVNPDFEKLQEKNRRKRLLQGAVGATVSSGGITPFVLVGQLLKIKNFDIPFVCPRCQGLESDSSVVTFCPNCGERRDEAVLRTCRRCQHHFGAAPHAHEGELWGPEEIRALPAYAPPALPAPAASPLPPPAAALAAAHAAPAAPAPAVPTPAFPTPVGAAPPPPPVTVAVAAAWQPDPRGRHQYRYWDGTRWTDQVADQGATSTDPF